MPLLGNAKRMPAIFRGPIARGSITSLAIRLTTIGLGFLQAILMARLLGPEGFGAVAIIVSVVSTIASLTMLGLGPFAVKEVASLSAGSDWQRLRGYVRFSIIAVATASGLGATAVLLFAFADGSLGPSLRLSVAISAILVPVIALQILLRGICQGFGRVVAALAPSDVARPIVFTVALAALYLASIPASGTFVIVLLAAANLAALIVAGRNMRRIAAALVPDVQPVTEAVRWVRSAAPFLGLTVLGILQGEVNTLMLGWLAGPGEAGLFQPLARMAPVMVLGADAISVRYAPRVAEYSASGDEAMLRRITGLFTVASTVATVVICVGILIMARWILAAFGEEFTTNVPALGWLAAAQIFNAACGPVGYLLLMTGRQGRAMIGQSVGLIVNLGLGVWLMPGLGALGAALAMSGGIVAWNIAMLISVRRQLGLDPTLPAVLMRTKRGAGDSQS